MALISICTFQFMCANSPTTVLLIVFIASLLVALILSFSSSWFSYIIFLIFIGGVIILILYIVSVIKFASFGVSHIFFTALFFMLSYTDTQTIKFLSNIYIVSKIPALPLIFINIIFLLITLLVVIKLIYFNRGPIQKIN